jgi:hypothetical protein
MEGSLDTPNRDGRPPHGAEKRCPFAAFSYADGKENAAGG